MTIAIIYDSIFGNTAQIAKAIATELESSHSVQIAAVGDAGTIDLASVELLIVGSPTRGFRPTPAIAEFIEGLDTASGSGRSAAAFDTRMGLEDIHPAPLRWVVEAGGYAADRIATMLAHKGFASAGPDAGFFVGGTEGPLKDGEIDRARQWARALLADVPK